MIRSVIHKLFKPFIRWHEEYRAEIVAEWLKIHNPDMTEAVALFRESRSAQFRRGSSWDKRSARRKALRKLRKTTSDETVHSVIHKQFPPLPRTWR